MALPKIYLLKKEDQDTHQLNLHFSFNGERLRYYTGIRIEEKYFNNLYFKSSVKKPIKNNYPYAYEINERLSDMCNFCVQMVSSRAVHTASELKTLLDEEFKLKKSVPSKDSYGDSVIENEDLILYTERLIHERYNGTRLIVSGNRIGQQFKKEGLKNMRSTLRTIKDFARKQKLKRIEFSQIDNKFYAKFREYCFKDLKLKDSTFASKIKDIKTIMNEANEDNITSEKGHQSKRFIKPKYETDSVAVDMQDLEKLQAYSFPPRLERVKDLFLVGCYTALRFSDFSSFDIIGLDGKFIRLKQTKTNERVTIPVMSRLAEILEKYDNKFPPAVTNQEFNRVIKWVFSDEGLGLDRDIIVKEEGIEKTVKFSSMISSHTGRRSYATNMFKAGVPVLLIMSATGHKTEESFLRYIRATNEDKSRMLAEWFEKLNF